MNKLIKFAKSFETPEGFKDWCKYKVGFDLYNSRVLHYNAWIVLCGFTEELTDDPYFDITAPRLSLEDLKILNRLDKNGIKIDSVLFADKNIGCEHELDYDYNYNNLFKGNTEMRSWLNEIVYMNYDYDFSKITMEKINSISPDVFVSHLINEIEYTTSPKQLNNFLFENRSKLSDGLIKELEKEHCNTKNGCTKLYLNLLLDKTDKLDDVKCFDPNSTRIKNSFSNIKMFLTETQMYKYFSDFTLLDYIENKEMLEYILFNDFDEYNLELYDELFWFIKNSYKNEKLSQILFADENEHFMIHICKRIGEFGVNDPTEIYNIISVKKPNWTKFILDCKPEPTNLV